MDRSKMPVKVMKMSEQEDAGDVQHFTTPEERFRMVMELSQNLWALKSGKNVEPELHRHVVRVFRRKG